MSRNEAHRTIKDDGDLIAIEHVGKYTITRIVEYMDGREL